MKRGRPRRRRRSSFTGLAVAYWSGRSTSARRPTCSRDTSPGWFALAVGIMIATVVPMAVALAVAARAQGMHERIAWLTRAYFVSYTAGQILPDRDRRRRGADLRDVAPAPRAARRDRRDRPARARRSAARRRCSSAPSASCSRSAATTSAPTSGSRARSSSRRSCSPSCSSRASRGRCCARPRRCCGGSGSSGPCARSTRASTHFRGHAAPARRAVRLHASRSRRCACSRSGRPRGPSGSSSRRGSTT